MFFIRKQHRTQDYMHQSLLLWLTTGEVGGILDALFKTAAPENTSHSVASPEASADLEPRTSGMTQSCLLETQNITQCGNNNTMLYWSLQENSPFNCTELQRSGWAIEQRLWSRLGLSALLKDTSLLVGCSLDDLPAHYIILLPLPPFSGSVFIHPKAKSY